MRVLSTGVLGAAEPPCCTLLQCTRLPAPSTHSPLSQAPPPWPGAPIPSARGSVPALPGSTGAQQYGRTWPPKRYTSAPMAVRVAPERGCTVGHLQTQVTHPVGSTRPCLHCVLGQATLTLPHPLAGPQAHQHYPTPHAPSTQEFTGGTPTCPYASHRPSPTHTALDQSMASPWSHSWSHSNAARAHPGEKMGEMRVHCMGLEPVGAGGGRGAAFVSLPQAPKSSRLDCMPAAGVQSRR